MENNQDDAVHRKTVFVVLTVARMIDGEYIAVKPEKAFTKASQADALLKQLKERYTTPEGKIRPVKISTPQGDLECFCEIGAFDLELEE